MAEVSSFRYRPGNGRMTTGDVLEILGAACLTVAASLLAGLVAALIVLGVTLVYEGQCHGATPFPQLPKRAKPDDEANES